MNRALKKIAAGVVGLAGIFNQFGCASTPISKPLERFNQASEIFLPLCQRDQILIYHDDKDEYAINFNYILRTGNAKIGTYEYNNYLIDWQAKDSFIQALQEIESQSLKDLKGREIVQELLAKPHWDLGDRKTWEKQLCDVVGRDTYELPAFQHYRHLDVKHGILNELAQDIDQHTEEKEFDCKATSLVRGILMQRIENQILLPSVDRHEFKQRFSYFYVSGGLSCPNGMMGGHAFILTPTGSIVDGTRSTGWGDYVLAANESSLEEFVRGNGIVTRDNRDFSSRDFSRHEVDRSLNQQEKRGLIDGGHKFTHSDLLTRQKDGHCSIMEIADEGIICVATSNHNDELYQIKIYQNQDVGSPMEGYVNVRDLKGVKQADGKFELAACYVDELRDQSYNFNVIFSPHASQPEIVTDYHQISSPNALAANYAGLSP